MAVAATARPSPTPPPPKRKESVACQTCPGDKKKKKHIKVRATLFFDGTLNNRVNTAAHNAWEGRAAGSRGRAPGSGSFENDFSNVAKLQWALSNDQPGYDHAIKIYVEGIGTTDNAGDDLPGKGYGTGQTGIIGKVTKGLTELYPKIETLVRDRENTTVEIALDSFGFSRGAAAARHYIHRAMEHGSDKVQKRLTDEGIQVTGVTMRFCGLFDTVSSFEPQNFRRALSPRFEDDVEPLNLRAVSMAQKTVQLAAADEHRINFSLTDITSAGGKGLQIYLPGAHSDVGGGYNDQADEVDNQVFDIGSFGGAAGRAAMQREQNWLITQGWYNRTEIEVKNLTKEIFCTRRGIRNHFARIPLQMMGQHAKGLALAFEAQLEGGSTNAVPERLANWHGTIRRLNAQSPGIYFGRSAPDLRVLRYQFLHFSAHYVNLDDPTAQGMQPRWTNDDPVNGSRHRLVIRG